MGSFLVSKAEPITLSGPQNAIMPPCSQLPPSEGFFPSPRVSAQVPSICKQTEVPANPPTSPSFSLSFLPSAATFLKAVSSLPPLPPCTPTPQPSPYRSCLTSAMKLLSLSPAAMFRSVSIHPFLPFLVLLLLAAGPGLGSFPRVFSSALPLFFFFFF